MKIAIPTEQQSLDISVCPSFGRAPYFLFYDIESNENSFMENPAASSQGGAGIKAAQIIVESKAQAILTPRCGGNAADVLNAAGIKIYKSDGGTVKDNIEAFKKGMLAILDDIHPGFHNHGK
jgi:predicted Fe-Mo cluster-binding NifX family protein